MSKKRIFVILIIFVILSLITIFCILHKNVFAEIFSITVQDEITDQEYEAQRKQKKLDYINNQKTNISSTYMATEDDSLIDGELLSISVEKENTVNNKGNKIEKIINKFYSEEYNILAIEMAENADQMSLNELYKQKYTEELFDLIIDIIKNKDITIEEKSLLKEFLADQYYFLEENSSMQLKFNEVLNNN